MKTLHFAVALLAACAFATSAHALSYSPQIDFRDSAVWSAAAGQTSFDGTQGGVSLSITATPSPAVLWWDSKDGLGVQLSYEKDEIEAEEILVVAFKQEVTLSSIYVSDLFVEHGYTETGSYRINGGAWVDFAADSLPGTGSNGEHQIAFGTAIGNVNLLEFSAPGKINGEGHEFALMGFDASGQSGPGAAVPEPTAALLFGAGVLSVAVGVRRRD